MSDQDYENTIAHLDGRLTTCSKEHCWDASLDNGWCNRHTNERIAQLEAENAKLHEAIDNALLCDTAVQMSEVLQGEDTGRLVR